MLHRKFIDIEGLGIGEKSFAKLKKLGLETPHDLFYYFPRKYEDYTRITQISNLNLPADRQDKGTFTIKGTLLGIGNKKTRRRRFTVTEGVVSDDSGSIKVVWFNQPYLARMLSPGSKLILSGKVSFDRFSSSLVMESPTRSNEPKIVPIYSETAGMTSFFIAKLFSKVKDAINEVEEWLPEEWLENSKHEALNPKQIQSTKKSNVISAKAGIQELDSGSQASVRNDNFRGLRLMPIREALLNIHEPQNSEVLERARRRLAFEELFLISLKGAVSRKSIEAKKAPVLETGIEALKKFAQSLPFKLTDDQRKAIWQIVKDIGRDRPMHRLLNGDVGSGKTVVAAVAAFIASEAGYRSFVMAPTEILANQHFETFKSIFTGNEKKIGLLTSSRKENLNSEIIVGTHALLYQQREFMKIGLVVVDEQHRFGVKQREELATLGAKKDIYPHFLSMTATPIPRTMHLVLFGELDVTLIKEKPLERKPIKTRFIDSSDRDKSYKFIEGQIENGRQAFVICPLIEEDDPKVIPAKAGIREDKNLDPSSEAGMTSQQEMFESERKTVVGEYSKLKGIFPEFSIGFLHGKMNAQEKREVMDNFSSNRLNILVCTSIVEVGVDIPNATVMIIEDAERFGLAQIHQFRGRVGRGSHQSYCFLFSGSCNPKVIDRLRLLEKVDDGFRLAEADLKMRGPGTMFGTEQSGLIDLKMASLADQEMIVAASNAANEFVKDLKRYPKLKEKLGEYVKAEHLE